MLRITSHQGQKEDYAQPMAFVESQVIHCRKPHLNVSPGLSIVIPTWNGGARLSQTLDHLRDFRSQLAEPTEIVIVDDCSESSTARIAADFASDNELTTVLRNERNRGKGYAVARGMREATGGYRIFVDSDLAYPSCQISKLLLALKAGNDVAIACRVLPESRYVMSPAFFHYLYTRHLMSRLFNRVAQQILLPGILDTQAGLKAFTARAAQVIFSRQTLSGFGFDLECLFIARLHGLRIKEVPVDFYYNSEPSTISFLRHGTQMLGDLVRIRLNARRGLYA
jgi:dolichyl-phosphate beta-glucosyltransferase